MIKKQKQLCGDILVWYAECGRDLPWRHTRDPYKILIAEVMLQQTQVSRVVRKYKEFVRAFPNTKKLAEAKTGDVITVWKGLGYNRRALFLQRTAQAVRTEFGGRFPQTFEGLKSMPGIGEYTARAILSFAFGVVTPVLDTNHRKFYQKMFFGDEVQSDIILHTKAEVVVAYIARTFGETAVYDWNQALMDWVSAHPEQYILPKKKKKQSIPFKQTNRYIRGKIIDLLRTEKCISLHRVYAEFPEYTKEHMREVVDGLVIDQLILREKQSILLP